MFLQVAAHLSVAADLHFFVYPYLTGTLLHKVGDTCCLHIELSMCCGVYTAQFSWLICISGR